jgi:hypothetical protein
LPLDKSAADVGLSFRYPSAWREYPYHVGFSFTSFRTFLSTATVPVPCVHSAKGIECTAPPQVDLAPGGVLIWFEYAGRPPHEPEGPDPQLTRIPGSLISVDGHDGRINVTAADPLCARDGGIRSMTLTVVRGNGISDGDPLVVNGCFAGPDTSAAEATMRAMAATIKLSSDGASSVAPSTS